MARKRATPPCAYLTKETMIQNFLQPVAARIAIFLCQIVKER